MSYRVVYIPKVLIDIQDAVDWYNFKQPGLGRKFYIQLKKHQKILSSKPLSFSIRYDEIHCLKISDYPYMFHYKVDNPNKRVIIFALFHTSRNPKNWDKRVNE